MPRTRRAYPPEFRQQIVELHRAGRSPGELAHVCGTFSGPVLIEIVRAGPQEEPHLPRSYDFKSGKVWPNHRPGLGVEFDPSRAELVSEVTKRFQPVPLFRRPDGSITNW